jgi:RNA 2',3'-cyclic 3'-phosphodiesterase
VTRLFVAVWPSEDVLQRLDDLPRPRDPGVRWVPRENQHITLRFLGDAEEDEVADRLEQVVVPGAVARLGPAIDVLAERTLVVPVGGLDELAATVLRHTRDLGTARTPRRFVGHLSVARLARRARPARSVGLRVEATFTVEEIALVASTLRDTGAEYETLGRWPIG